MHVRIVDMVVRPALIYRLEGLSSWLLRWIRVKTLPPDVCDSSSESEEELYASRSMEYVS
jgi:hypothetical protein